MKMHTMILCAGLSLLASVAVAGGKGQGNFNSGTSNSAVGQFVNKDQAVLSSLEKDPQTPTVIGQEAHIQAQINATLHNNTPNAANDWSGGGSWKLF